MTEALDTFVARELAAPVPPAVSEAAGRLANGPGVLAVLFYGAVLRTGDLTAMLDFYVLSDGPVTRGWRRAAGRLLWPDIAFEALETGSGTLRAKVATMPMAVFARAARGELTDTTIWTRFVQPAALVWSRDTAAADAVRRAAADAAVTAARFAAVLGPMEGEPLAYWRALFRETYRAELRVEPAGREESILTHDAARYRALLPLVWAAGGVTYEEHDGALQPGLTASQRRAWRSAWARRRQVGRGLNAARLVKATFTTPGAAGYGLWKLERHTGVRLRLSPFAERHPLLAAPGLLWQLWRARRA